MMHYLCFAASCFFFIAAAFGQATQLNFSFNDSHMLTKINFKILSGGLHRHSNTRKSFSKA